MADLDIAPDLNKAPPHVEGDLLRQGSQSIFGRKSWKKYFFIVLKDKLQYFGKRDDYRLNKDPEAYIRISQVVSITEVVFNGVPKKHHLNCGFSVEAFHPETQQKVTLNLLAETPEDMRYWVFALRYIKAYYAKMKNRETVMNEEAERKILEKLLSGVDGQEDEDNLVWGEYSLSEEGGPSIPAEDSGSSAANVSVFFADGSKTKVHMESTDMTSDLLEKEDVKKHLTSSAAHLWLIDSIGNDMILKPDDHPALFPGKMQKLYALDHVHRVLPIFYTKKDFECIVVPTTTTADKILEHHDISVQIDFQGITNCGLFLRTDTGEEMMFASSECPCDLLFSHDVSGVPVRQPVGKLVLRNKSLGGGRSITKISRRPRTTLYKPDFRSNSEEHKIMEEKYEEEQAQAEALDLIWNKQKGRPAMVPVIEGPSLSKPTIDEVDIDGEQWVVATDTKQHKRRSPSPSLERHSDTRDLEEAVVVSQSNGVAIRKGTVPSSMESSRSRSSAISSVSTKSRSSTAAEAGTRMSVKEREGGSPLMSPKNGSPTKGRSKSPGRRLPDVPDSVTATASLNSESHGSSNSPFRRRHVIRPSYNKDSGSSGSDTRSISLKLSSPSSTVRSHSNSISGATLSSLSGSITSQDVSSISVTSSLPVSGSAAGALAGKGPTIHFSGQESPTPPVRSAVVSSSPGWEAGPGPAMTRHTRSATIRSSGVENLRVNSSRSSNFGQSRQTSSTVLPDSHLEQPQQPPSLKDPSTSATPLVTGEVTDVSVAETTVETVNKQEPVELRPMVIDFKALQVVSPSRTSAGTTESSREEHAAAADEVKPKESSKLIKVTSPNLLKMILLQSSEAVESTRPMDFILLSGVALYNHKGVWSIQEGCNFHDELPADCDDHTETFRLPGGIRTVYNHTHKRWHVLPPTAPSSVPSADNSMEESISSIDGGQENKTNKLSEASQRLYLTKKVLMTEVGTAFHKVVEMFAQTRDTASKKKIGSDMMNPAMGHLVRGHFCSSLAALLLDGLRPYRFQGIVQDDIWKITLAFCNSAASDPSCSLVSPSIEKLIFQPINALKATMKDNNIKFRTFVCLAMSRGMLTGWLEALPKQTAVLRKYYLPSGFLYLVSENHAFQLLYQEMLLTLEPMIYLPFDLSIDFETRHSRPSSEPREEQSVNKTSFINPSADVVDGGEEPVRSVSPAQPSSSSSSDQSPSQVRSHVVIKTHAATGQRTAAGNVLNAVWDTSPLPSPSHSPTLPSHAPSMQVSHTSTVSELDGISETKAEADRVKGKEEERRVPKKEDSRQSSEQPEDLGQTFKRFGGSLLKKFSDGFQQINRGGAITGVPSKNKDERHSSPPLTSTPPPAPAVLTTRERIVQALYTNECDDADELCFNKGDRLVVKEQINEEWLICSHGGKTGIVPMNYITPLSS